MRAFIAIDFNDDEYFKKIQEQIPTDTAKIKPTTSYHLTLKFLGEVEDNKIEAVKYAENIAGKDDLILVTGSCFVVGKVLRNTKI